MMFTYGDLEELLAEACTHFNWEEKGSENLQSWCKWFIRNQEYKTKQLEKQLQHQLNKQKVLKKLTNKDREILGI